jgi:hypothetical protein
MGLRQLHHAEVCTLSGRGKARTPMRPITGRRSLSPRSLTRSTNSFPCGLPARYRDELRRWRTIGLTVFRIKDKSRLGSAFSPTVVSPCVPTYERDSRLYAFWLKPNSAFGLLLITTFISSSHSLTVLPNLAPHPPRRWQTTTLSREIAVAQ